MGRSPKPLSILVHPSCAQSVEDNDRLCELESQGFTIVRDVPSDVIKQLHYDIILGPSCWRAFDLKYLDLAIKSARSVKYGKAKKSVTIKAKSKGKKSAGRRKTNNEVDAAQLRIDDSSNKSDLMAGSGGSRE